MTAPRFLFTIAICLTVAVGCEKNKPDEPLKTRISTYVITLQNRTVTKDIISGKIISDESTPEKIISTETFFWEGNHQIAYNCKEGTEDLSYDLFYSGNDLIKYKQTLNGEVETYFVESKNGRILNVSYTDPTIEFYNVFTYDKYDKLVSMYWTDKINSSETTINYSGNNVCQYFKLLYKEGAKEDVLITKNIFDYNKDILNPLKGLLRKICMESPELFVSDNVLSHATSYEGDDLILDYDLVTKSKDHYPTEQTITIDYTYEDGGNLITESTIVKYLFEYL